MPIAELADEMKCDSEISLRNASIGCEFHIRHINGPACESLRRMGFCETMRIKKLADGRNLLCTICGTRMAVSRELAEHVMLVPV